MEQKSTLLYRCFRPRRLAHLLVLVLNCRLTFALSSKVFRNLSPHTPVNVKKVPVNTFCQQYFFPPRFSHINNIKNTLRWKAFKVNWWLNKLGIYVKEVEVFTLAK